MPYYELLCLASGKLNRAELGSVITKTCRAFMDNGGVVTRIVPMGATGYGPRELAYPIRLNQVSYKTAFCVNVCAFSSPAALNEVNRQLKIDERILRHLSIRKTIEDSVKNIPDVDEIPPIKRQLDPTDPDFALRKFLEEYDREFPDGTGYHAGQELITKTTPGEEGGKFRNRVDDFVASLNASSKNDRAKKDSGLGWLADLDKKPSGNGGR